MAVNPDESPDGRGSGTATSRCHCVPVGESFEMTTELWPSRKDRVNTADPLNANPYPPDGSGIVVVLSPVRTSMT